MGREPITLMGEGTPSLSSLDADYVAAVTPSRIVVNDFPNLFILSSLRRTLGDGTIVLAKCRDGLRRSLSWGRFPLPVASELQPGQRERNMLLAACWW